MVHDHLPMKRLSLCAIVLTALPAAAQHNAVQEATQALLAVIEPKLTSAKDSEVAWGAHLASRFQLAEAGRSLRHALQVWRDKDGEEARQVRLHLIDAIWAAKVKLPEEEYAFLLDDLLTRVPAFLVATQDIAGNAQLLARLTTTALRYDDAVPEAAGRLLVDHNIPVPTFTRNLLARAHCVLWVKVRDQGTPEDGGWNSAVGIASGPYKACAGFPPLAIHELHRIWAEKLSPGETVLCMNHSENANLKRDQKNGTASSIGIPEGGRRADPGIAHSRELRSRLEQRNLPIEKRPAPDPAQAIVWLERMALVPLPTHVHLTVQWKDADALQAAAAECRTRLLAQGIPLLPALIARHWLPAGDTTAFVWDVHVTLSDERANRSDPLPQLEGSDR